MSSFDSTMRVQALMSIHRQLEDMILNPPRRVTKYKEVDLGKVSDRLDELKPFWNAYLSVVKPHDGYNFQNMLANEQNMYLACMFWYGMLDDITKVGDAS